jgi:D-alanyl-D-alanine carboxypeptidase/D-alanyl-D-alanine-endopeptidase (penicillin-binding protein 4)
MKNYLIQSTVLFSSFFAPVLTIHADDGLPQEMQKIINQDKYRHAFWGIYAKDLKTGKVLFDLNSDKLFSPASTTKLFSVAALFNAYGENYKFKTPVYSTGKISNGKLDGNLVLVGQGDFVFGGRFSNPNVISFTKLDHINANSVPGVSLTKEDPLHAVNELAQQIYDKGLRELNGDVIIDTHLFETTEKREMTLSPVAINENLIDFVVNPTSSGQKAELSWRPQVPGYEVLNQVKTVAHGEPLELDVTADETGRKLTIKGTIPAGQKDIVRTYPVKDPAFFVKSAFVKALKDRGIKINAQDVKANFQPNDDLKIAEWVSAPLSEYGKLILKVSHNYGADLVALLLAAKNKQNTFDEGMRLIGDFVTKEVNLSPDAFVFGDAAGGNENRLTLQAEVDLLEYMHKKSPEMFKGYYDGLPILGVDGSLQDVAKKSSGEGKIRAKTGTGVAYNPAVGKFFLITQALAGYIEGKDGHMYAFEVVVNNGKMPTIDDVFAIFEDQGQISSLIYDSTSSEKENDLDKK